MSKRYDAPCMGSEEPMEPMFQFARISLPPDYVSFPLKICGNRGLPVHQHFKQNLEIKTLFLKSTSIQQNLDLGNENSLL